MMFTWSSTVSQNASMRVRRGAQDRNGTSPSVTYIMKHATDSIQGGLKCAYQLVHVGIGCVSKWNRRAVMFRHELSPLNHLTSAERNISRKSSQRIMNRTIRD